MDALNFKTVIKLTKVLLFFIITMVLGNSTLNENRSLPTWVALAHGSPCGHLTVLQTAFPQHAPARRLTLINGGWGRAEILVISGQNTCKLTDTEIYKAHRPEEPCHPFLWEITTCPHVRLRWQRHSWLRADWKCDTLQSCGYNGHSWGPRIDFPFSGAQDR